MRAAVMRRQQIVVDQMAMPVPGSGQVLVKTLACGICGSDLHMLKHGPRLSAEAAPGDRIMSNMDFERDVVMGHEFCAEVLEFGPDCQTAVKPGQKVCSLPAMLGPGWRRPVGYSNDFNGGYGEYMLLHEQLLLPVHENVTADLAALTEPLAVGLHAVEKAQIEAGAVPLVVGCGPVGLAVIVALKSKGLGPILAADYSPARRALALAMGADEVIDPAVNSPHESWRRAATLPDAPPPALGPIPERLKPAVIFECVGVPGVIDQIMAGAPQGGRIVVVGVCMETVNFRPYRGIIKELNLQFVLGYTPDEFAACLALIDSGKLDLSPLITGHVGLDGVAGAFEDLADPDHHCKIMVEPHRH
ncbi:MAG: zinc-binding dehydrogenase [Rhodospirillaceae bacterium]|nr:zinc-binding dehydrogenase [Rhodospirillaceae bacterium]MBT5898147.1 zinc-binding dehydrogenase [Rhodospirillaceae bacterium]MBT6426871.1 zinc-binding dehydrogenase [Rhodospirillaceae bacterium]